MRNKNTKVAGIQNMEGILSIRTKPDVYKRQDIDCEKCYDIIFARAKQVMFTSNEGEKIQVRLASDRIANIQLSLIHISWQPRLSPGED